jgi:hypothetical protein
LIQVIYFQIQTCHIFVHCWKGISGKIKEFNEFSLQKWE